MVASTETTPLLSNNLRKKTPLPWLQLSVVLLVQVCEPLACLSIYPYINELISKLDIIGGDERKVGYYAGLIESLFFVVEALTVLQWSRLSDYIGRKPVMLIGLFGLSLSMLCFGLSQTFWGLVVSRCLCGLLNGNIGVMKSTMGELTDSTNRAEGFSMLPIVWAAGATLGPMMGGVLSKPSERFPKVFTGLFWKEYPYFLPCLVAALFISFTCFIVLVFFKETAPKKARRTASEDTLVFKANNEPVSLRQLLVYPVIISVANYMAHAFLNICLNSLIPLFFAMPLEIGGLGFEPATIGYTTGIYGAGVGIFQVFFFAKIVHRWGEKRLFVTGMLMYLPMFALFPITSYLAQQYGVSTIVWVCISMMLPPLICMDMAYSCIFMYVTASAPNKHSLGATNGLSQTSVSVARAIGPAMATSLYSVSVEHNLLGGYAVYAILFTLSCLGILLALRLPEKVWPEAKDSDSDSDCT